MKYQFQLKCFHFKVNGTHDGNVNIMLLIQV